MLLVVSDMYCLWIRFIFQVDFWWIFYIKKRYQPVKTTCLSTWIDFCDEKTFFLNFFNLISILSRKISRKTHSWHSMYRKCLIEVVLANFPRGPTLCWGPYWPSNYLLMYKTICFVGTLRLRTHITIFWVIFCWTK